MDRIEPKGIIETIIALFLTNRLVLALWVAAIILAGLYVMPFNYGYEYRKPIPVDAIPDIGEKQVIVFADWEGRSPQDVEDQLTYLLTVNLQGIAGVKTVRSFSMFGFAACYIIFGDEVDFYWARSRVLEKLSLAREFLPDGASAYLGPDASGLGQIFWYTLEAPGSDLQELRSIQDWYVRPALQSVEGVSEVASVGGFVKEYQIDVNPEAMRAFQVTLGMILEAVQKSNLDISAQTIEHSGVEYIVRGRGFLRSIGDIEKIAVRERNGVPVLLRDIASVALGPALRRGVLDKNGVEAVGGIVIARYGENPLAVISRVKARIAEIEPGLAGALANGSVSSVTIVPFYDRTELIHETLATLNSALVLQVLVTAFVVFIILHSISGSFVIAVNIPLGIMLTFVLMRMFGVESNLMTLGGIAISIGAMVDMGIILYENTLRRYVSCQGQDSRIVAFAAAREVGSAVVTAIATTIVSFLPVFVLMGPEGKLFKPLAFTKTFALFASVLVALTVTPALAAFFLKRTTSAPGKGLVSSALLVAAGIVAMWYGRSLGVLLVALALCLFVLNRPGLLRIPLSEKVAARLKSWCAALVALALLTALWMPLGHDAGFISNMVIVFVPPLLWLLLAWTIIPSYPSILGVFLRRKKAFLAVPLLITLFGVIAWLGFGRVFSFVPATLSRAGIAAEHVTHTSLWQWGYHAFPGFGKEFMPSLHEGSFLWMPITMPHASISEAHDIMRKQNMLFEQIPEVDFAVGKLGRAETALDPAPINMIETLIQYVPEYAPPDPETGRRERLWRDHIKNHRDIWNEVTATAALIPGSTSAPMLGPIETRIVMLQTGMRSSLGVKVFGGSLDQIEKAGQDIAALLKHVPGIRPETVVPDIVTGKPYLEIDIDREAIARYGLTVVDVQETIEAALGGARLTQTIEGRERYPVRVRYQRELRDSPEALGSMYVSASATRHIPLSALASVQYVKGPQEIKSEDTFKVAYITFDREPGTAEVDVVERASAYVNSALASGELALPSGLFYRFAGSYENQQHFQRTLNVVLPLSLGLIFLILYVQFRAVPLTLIVFAQIACVWGGAFAGMWIIGQDWFLNFNLLGANLRELYNLRDFNLSVPMWVGFLALFGIATDDAVVMATYLKQAFENRASASVSEIRAMVVRSAQARIRPCFMTTITTVLALIPLLTSLGRGSEVLLPLSIPILCGMTFELITFYITPVLFCWLEERKVRRG